jgi:iron complex transport system substrate-binding protein
MLRMRRPQGVRRAARRARSLAVIASVASLAIVTACGSSDDDDDAAASDTSEATGAPATSEAPSGDADAFPVTVEHKYGSTTVEEAPTRVVTVGLIEQDALLALGIVPVATTEWFGEYPGAVFPWAQDELEALGAEPPASLGNSNTVNFEAIAAQRPDLILALYSGITQQDYDRLAAIAPTVAQPADFVDYGMPWQDLTLTVGEVVGKADEAAALVDEVDAQLAAAREDHPEFEGASAVVATPYEGIWVYGPQDPRGRILTSLGFELPPDLAEVTGEEFGGDLSEERADLLDVDAIVWLDAAGAEEPIGGPLYASFDVHTEGREVHLVSFGDALGEATSFVSVLSLPYLVDGLVPMLAAAVDGDPATDPTEAVPTAKSTPPTSGATTDAEPAAFPVTVEHALGTTEILAAPERIVTVGLTEQDTVLALGETPVGVTEWYGERPYATWPWAQDELGDATPAVLEQADGLQFERMAALEPDLILGLNAGLDEESYATLSAIAPTVAHPVGADSYFSPWREQTLLIGEALGQADEAQALIDDVDAQFAAARAANPEFEGVPVVFLQNALYDGEAIAYQEGLSTDFLTDLGFTIPDGLDRFVRDEAGSQAYIPLEQLSVLDAADVLLWGTEGPGDREELEKVDVYQSLEEVEEGRLVFTDGLTAGAIYFTSPLSLPFVIEQLVPAFRSTLAGDGPADAFAG